MALTLSEVNLATLTANAKIIKKNIGKPKLLAILKANAYGHGVGPVARAVIAGGAEYLGVARIEEAEQLRAGGVGAPILIIGKVLPEEITRAASVGVEITLSDMDSVQSAQKVAKLLGKTIAVHLKVDTGMGRQGFFPEEAEKVFPKIFAMPELRVEGIFTHFSCADTDVNYTESQNAKLENLLQKLKKKGVKLPLIHASNSGGFLRDKKYHHKMVRIGIGLYGYSSVDAPLNKKLKPALTFKSHVVSVRNLPKDFSVGYDATYRTTRPTRTAVVGAGYADGVPTELSNTGKIIINGKKYPIIGKVCMDQLMVDITGDKEIKTGDEAVIYGKQGSAEISLQKTAQAIGKTPYELCCAISARVPRIYKS